MELVYAQSATRLLNLLERKQMRFPIKTDRFIGEWTPEDRAIVISSCLRVGRVLSRFGSASPQRTFALVFDGLVFSPNSSLRKYYGFTSAGGKKITLKPGHLSIPLVIHELGHAFNDRLPAGVRPYKLLYREQIRLPNGKSILGQPAPKNGFASDVYGPDRQHPAHWDSLFQYVEDWADMFMHWCLGSLPESEAGKARGEWMERHMREWLADFEE